MTNEINEENESDLINSLINEEKITASITETNNDLFNKSDEEHEQEHEQEQEKEEQEHEQEEKKKIIKKKTKRETQKKDIDTNIISIEQIDEDLKNSSNSNNDNDEFSYIEYEGIWHLEQEIYDLISYELNQLENFLSSRLKTIDLLRKKRAENSQFNQERLESKNLPIYNSHEEIAQAMGGQVCLV